MKRTLVVVAKWPEVGQAKTRLAAETTAEWAAAAALAFLCDTLARVGSLACDRLLYFSPPQRQPDFASLAMDRFQLTPQVAGDLGQRMDAVIREQLHAGARAVVLIGSDSPSLPIHYIAQAFSELARHDLVVGPASDGGYYLLGASQPVSELLKGIEWGSPKVLLQTMQKLQGRTERLALLPPWYDVDTLADCQLLRGHMLALRHSGVDPQMPHCEAVLDRMPTDAHAGTTW
jgi:rSAM/selenodomain-associated transferase 1